MEAPVAGSKHLASSIQDQASPPISVRGRRRSLRSADRCAVMEAKPLINANGREWSRMKRSCFPVDCAADYRIHFLLDASAAIWRNFSGGSGLPRAPRKDSPDGDALHA